VYQKNKDWPYYDIRAGESIPVERGSDRADQKNASNRSFGFVNWLFSAQIVVVALEATEEVSRILSGDKKSNLLTHQQFSNTHYLHSFPAVLLVRHRHESSMARFTRYSRLL
jgi:hypothetical protein